MILLETLLRSDSPGYGTALDSVLLPASVEKVIDFSKSQAIQDLRPHFAKIDHIDLVAFEYFSSEAAGLTFLAVGDSGPLAIEVRFYVSPNSSEKPVVQKIIAHDTWERIRACFSAQRKLPASLRVTGTFQNHA